ncbi:MAG: hypothetical protein IKI61_07095, partial [Erysipelotrichaceae bacterium]|nr:hypothetical protein [Erysipelotrichaceae bacterium]
NRKIKIQLLLLLILFSACRRNIKNESGNKTDNNELSQKKEQTMKMYINAEKVSVLWEDNESVKALNGLLPIEIEMKMYGDFEQVGSIGKKLPRNDVQMTTKSGDIVLYAGDQLVVFYGSNSWAYTKLGKIDLNEDKLKDLLGNGDVKIALKNE